MPSPARSLLGVGMRSLLGVAARETAAPADIELTASVTVLFSISDWEIELYDSSLVFIGSASAGALTYNTQGLRSWLRAKLAGVAGAWPPRGFGLTETPSPVFDESDTYQSHPGWTQDAATSQVSAGSATGGARDLVIGPVSLGPRDVTGIMLHAFDDTDRSLVACAPAVLSSGDPFENRWKFLATLTVSGAGVETAFADYFNTLGTTQNLYLSPTHGGLEITDYTSASRLLASFNVPGSGSPLALANASFEAAGPITIDGFGVWDSPTKGAGTKLLQASLAEGEQVIAEDQGFMIAFTVGLEA